LSKVTIKFNQSALNKLGKDAANAFAEHHQHDCIVCGKPVRNDEPLKPGMVPVHMECAKAKGMI
jgi:hypothetical protein